MTSSSTALLVGALLCVSSPTLAGDPAEYPLTAEEMAVENEVFREAHAKERKRQKKLRKRARELRQELAERAREAAEAQAEPPSPPKEWGVFVRGSVEYAWVHVPFAYTGSFASNGAAAKFEHFGTAERSAVGGRLEGGFAFGADRSFAVVPRGSVAFAAIDTIAHRFEFASAAATWFQNPLWWSVAGGAELQFLERAVGVSAELGTAAVSDQSFRYSPDSLSLSGAYRGGIFGRGAMSVRLPWWTTLGGGFTAAAEFLGWRNPDEPSEAPRDAWRVTLGLFAEWDHSRK